MLRVSRHYDALLTRAYGDYMTLPPEDKRKPAHASQRQKH